MDFNLLDNHVYFKPFKYGWRRELVVRTNTKQSHKIRSDVYYYTPDRQKVRSMRKIFPYIKDTDLTKDNFTFAKVSLGFNDPKMEVIRYASSKKRRAKNYAQKAVKTPKLDISEVLEPQPSTSGTSPMTTKGTVNERTIPVHVVEVSCFEAHMEARAKMNLRTETSSTSGTDELDNDVNLPPLEFCICCTADRFIANGVNLSLLCNPSRNLWSSLRTRRTPVIPCRGKGPKIFNKQSATRVASPPAATVDNSSTTNVTPPTVTVITSSSFTATITSAYPFITGTVSLNF